GEWQRVKAVEWCGGAVVVSAMGNGRRQRGWCSCGSSGLAVDGDKRKKKGVVMMATGVGCGSGGSCH
nr:hypothetical protein [Tanacetum cinerariifolium]